MTTNKPFTQSIVELEGCSLTSLLLKEDASVLADMLAESDPWLTLAISAQMLESYLVREDLCLHRYLVRVNNELAGVLCVRYPWLRGPYIELLGLAPGYRNLGLGKQLLDWAESEARLESKNLWVVASSFNHKALQFYQRHGFNPVGTLEGLVRPDKDEILLRKSWD